MTEPVGPWLKLWCSLLENPKFMMLPAEDKELWLLMLLSVKRDGTDGELSPPDRLAFACRTTIDRIVSVTDRLVEKGLIDRLKGGQSGARYRFHDWDEWQENRGKSSTSTERVKRFRERSRNVAETPSRARAETREDLDKDKDKDRALHARTASPDLSDELQSQSEGKSALVRSVDDGPEIQARDPMFERVWAGYLEFGDARSPKPKAERLWRSLNPEAHNQVASGLVVWALVEGQARKTDPDRKVKYLDTWLEAGLWEQYSPAAFPQFAPTAQRIVDRWFEA